MFVTNDADLMDAVKMYAGFLGVGTVTADGSWLCIDRRKKLANPGESYSIPLKVSYPKETPTDIRLYFGMCESGNDGYHIQLVDKLKKITTTISNNSEYLYSINNTAEKASDRFEIVFTGKEIQNSADDIKNKVAIYPNPAEDQLNILNPAGIKVSKIEITTIDGKILKTVSPSLNNNLQTIDISEIPSGIYLIQVSTQSGIVSKKLLKN